MTEELELLAAQNEATPLVILGHEVDKTDARQVYGALCWIESQLLALVVKSR